jgi:DNA-binding NarL/FixJ family response regulator
VEVAGVGDSAALVRSARESLLRHPGEGLLVCIDDAHHLDNLSATLAHQLALTGSARLILTVRTGEPAPDAITALWKDGILSRVDIEPFDRIETTQLIEAVLGGSLETASANKVFDVCQGNPLYLRHLVEGVVDSGALREVEGVWQLRGEMVLTPHLSTLIGDHLQALPSQVKSVLEYLAVEEPLTLADLTALTNRAAIEEAEKANAIEVRARSDDLVVHSAHPFYTEGVRASLGRLTARRLRTDVVAQLSSRPAKTVSARLRLADLAIDTDNPPPVDNVIASSYEAMRLGDLVLGERLARSALARSGGLTSRLPLAHALAWLGRGRETDEVLAPVDPAQLSEWELTSWTLPKAANQFWMLDEPEQAMFFLTEMRTRVTDPGAVSMIDALAATFAMNAGDPRQAVQVTTSILAWPLAPELTVAWAAATATLASARLGRFGDVGALAKRGLSAQHPGLLRFTIGLGEITTSLMTETVMRAQRQARDFMEFSGLQEPGRAIGQVLLARTLMVTGELAAASTLLREAAAALAQTGYSWGPLALMYLAQAMGQRGDSAAAAKVLARAQSRHSLRSQLYAAELGLAEAWTLAAAHDLDGAITAARAAARTAQESGQSAVALHALHESVRLGDNGAVDAIAELLDTADCTAGRVALAHARAVATADADSLDRVALELADLGMCCAAADASAQAALAYVARHDRKGELRAKARAAELRGDAATPVLGRVLSALPLTERELQIGVMVAQGLSNKAIAERLCVSVRTVEGHIYRACSKVDAPDRAALGYAVAATKSGSALRETTTPSADTI